MIQKDSSEGRTQMVKFAMIEKVLIVVFFSLTVLAILLATVLAMRSTALILLLINFLVAGFVAIFGSLRLCDEEEEKLFKGKIRRHSIPMEV